MLHSRFQSHTPFGTGEFLTIYGHGGHLGRATQNPDHKFDFPQSWMLPLNLAWIGQRFEEKDVRK